jgi:tRNA uridine 5-carboxymethylaminomethyl modification enzyme
MPGPGIDDQEAAEQVEIEAKYAGYVSRQLEEIARQRGQEHQALPLDFDYMGLTSLSIEVRQKLNQARRRRWVRLRAWPASRRRRFRC